MNHRFVNAFVQHFKIIAEISVTLLHAPPSVCNIFGCWGWKWPQALHPAESLQGPPYRWLLHHLIRLIDDICTLSISLIGLVDQTKHIDQPQTGTKPVLQNFTPPCSDLCCAPYTLSAAVLISEMCHNCHLDLIKAPPDTFFVILLIAPIKTSFSFEWILGYCIWKWSHNG